MQWMVKLNINAHIGYWKPTVKLYYIIQYRHRAAELYALSSEIKIV